MIFSDAPTYHIPTRCTLPPHAQLERLFAEWNELPPENMVVCSSGTAALHLAFECLNYGQPLGKRVAVPDYSMIACARAVTMAGLVPELIPCDDGSLLMNLYRLREVIDYNSNQFIWGVLLVHTFGRYASQGLLHADGRGKNLAIVEDLAEAHGIRPNPRSDAACWSFYKNKVVHGQEGGAVYFKDVKLAQLARELRSLGFTKEHNYWHRARGCNYRMADCLAELIIPQLEKTGDIVHPTRADHAIEARKIIAGWYDEKCPDEWMMPPRSIDWVYDIRIPGMSMVGQHQVVSALQEQGIEARHGFKSISLQEEYAGKGLYHGGLTEAQRAQHDSEIIYLPVNLNVTQNKVAETFNVIKRVRG